MTGDLRQADPRSVFVVQGRDLTATKAVFDFLRAIDLHPLEWPELVASTGSGAPVVDQVVGKGLENPQAVVVVFTPDDEARLREPYQQPNDPDYETTLTGQPRQNVLLETGSALALYRERTIIVQFGEIRPVSNLAGLHVLHVQDSSEFRHQLANRLKTAGCAVNTSGDQWLSAGDFAAALAKIAPLSQDQPRGIVTGKKDPNGPPISAMDQAGGASKRTGVDGSLSEDAKELFAAAYDSRMGGYISRRRAGGILYISTMNRKFVQSRVTEAEAQRWESALNELYEAGLVDDNGSRETFYLTTQGQEFLSGLH